ncbi:MAG: ribonuclease E/G, partial [Clostridiales bacterium]|nr:ribonuclease E/G [Clostridiales bacterium]
NRGQWKDWGIVIRTNASEVSDEVLLKELWELSEKGSIVLKTACHKTCYSLLYAETSAWSKQMRSLRRKELEEIVTDNREIYEEICAYYQIPPNHLITGAGIPTPVDQIKTAEGICLRYHRDAALSLSALYGIKAKLEDALKVRVWLKSGAYLMIEHTEALTVIDVNTGKNVEKKRMQENFLKINLEAAAEIARQLRLRNLSGIILVDFMNLTDPDANQRLLTSLREAVKADPVPTQIIDMTRLGLVEITRKKEKKSLRELLGYGT